MQFNKLKDKCEYYRGLSDYRLMPNGYILVMIDGHSFSKKIKNKFNKPFDASFINAMNETAIYVCKHVQGIRFAYVQSDEISFLIEDNTEQGAFFDLRYSKLLSLISSYASTRFTQLITSEHLRRSGITDTEKIIEEVSKSTLYEFDCKAWNVPNINEAYAWYLYRQHDCVRNSKQQSAQTYIPHKELEGKKCDEQIDILKERHGIDWHGFTQGEKYGRMILKVERERNGVMRNVWEAFGAPDFNTLTAEAFNEINLLIKTDEICRQ